MAFFLVQPGQVLQSPVDERTFTADDKGIVQVSDDLQTQFHNMGATLWVGAPADAPAAVAAPTFISDPAPKAKGTTEDAPE